MLTLVAITFSHPGPDRLLLGVAFVLVRLLGVWCLPATARLLRRPGVVPLAVAGLFAIVAIDGAWGSPFVGAAFPLMGVAVVVSDCPACSRHSPSRVTCLLCLVGDMPVAQLLRSDKVDAIVNNIGDFALVAAIFYLAIRALRSGVQYAPSILESVRDGGEATTPTLAAAICGGIPWESSVARM